ncbi:MAG TPA: site-specific integrase [Kiritimatiellia bacterium]|nr:site-specific integrase [Kiritimatiellia bacterium]HPS08916.1 site-specific integrase [Kiritimatiellia bacterium]
MTRLDVTGYSRAVAQVGFHSLRHAHITALLEGGVPMDMVRQQAGHSTIGMTAHYYHASEKALQAATQALPPINGTSGADAPDAKLEAVLAELEGLSKEEMEKVAARVKAMLEV